MEESQVQDPVTEAPEPEDRGDVVLPEAEQATAPEPAVPAEEEDQRPQGIPKARFDQVNEQRKELQRQLDELKRERSSSPPPAEDTFDEDFKEQAYIDALMRGDTRGAAQIRREINAYVRAEATKAASEQLSSQVAARDLNAEAQEAVKQYPFLGTDEGAQAVELITAVRDASIRAGKPPGLALREAVALVAPKFSPIGFAPAKQELDSRTQEAIKRGAADSLQQPPTVNAGIGSRATGGRVDVASLTEDQFDALPESEKRKLRGD